MAAELRELAEYLLTCRNPKPYQKVEALCEAVLAEHPADEAELIDEAFLRRCGGNKDEFPNKWTFHRPEGMSIGLWHVDDGWKVMLIHDERFQSCIVRGLTTCGQLRRLFAALGVTLKEKA